MLTITLPYELEMVLTQHARATGSTPEQIALDTLQRNLLPRVTATESQTAWAARLRRVATPAGISLSDDVLSREALYE